jgi:GDP-4-dehydro-6-deoxy-D-mannose reductase
LRILITGVGGFVASHLVRELITHGHHVWGTDRTGARVEGIEDHHSFPADLRNRQEIQRLLEQTRPQAIIHLAAQSSPATSWDKPGETLESNAAATAHLVAEAAAQDPSIVFLLVSSSDVYGRTVHTIDGFTELCPPNPCTPYAVSKVAAEQVATLLAERTGLRLIIARPFSHTGPGQTDRFVVPAFARQIALIEAGSAEFLHHGDLDPCRDFTDVRDIVRAYRLLVEDTHTRGVYNICSEQWVSVRTLLDWLIARAECPIIPVPDPKRIRGEAANPIHGSAQRIREATDWTPQIPLSQTLADVLAEQRLLVLPLPEDSLAEGT